MWWPIIGNKFILFYSISLHKYEFSPFLMQYFKMQAVSFKKMKIDQRTLVMLFEMEHSVVDMIIKDFRYCFIVVHSSIFVKL